MEDNCFTMCFCCTTVWLSCMFTYILSLLSLPPTPTRHPIPLGRHRALIWAPCVYSSFPPAICFTHGCVYVSVLISQFVPPSPSHTGVFNIFQTAVMPQILESQFCMCSSWLWSLGPFSVPERKSQSCPATRAPLFVHSHRQYWQQHRHRLFSTSLYFSQQHLGVCVCVCESVCVNFLPFTQ